MIIGDTNFGIQPWPEVKTTPALMWAKNKLGTGYNSGRDLGVAKDIYEGKILVTDTPSVLDSLQRVLAANRNGIALSSFNSAEIIFGADVDYSGSINATFTTFGPRQNLFNDVLFDLQISFRAIAPTLLTTTPSLASLRLQEKWQGDKSFDITKIFSYNNTPTYIDHKTDAGLFKGSFIQTTDEMKAIRAYLLKTARAEPVPFPKLFSTAFYPFGANAAEGAFQKCHVISWLDRQTDLGWWNLEITFAQASPYFSAGSVDDTNDALAILASPTDSPDFYATPE